VGGFWSFPCPGVLGEGFAALESLEKDRPFKMRLAVEQAAGIEQVHKEASYLKIRLRF
jgi:hypothetical protein